jgi:hypothetical protein
MAGGAREAGQQLALRRLRQLGDDGGAHEIDDGC